MSGSSRKPDSKAGRMRAAVLAIYANHKAANMLPTSCRFIFYELVSLPKSSEFYGLVTKQQLVVEPVPGKKGRRRPDQDVNDALTTLRKDGVIPWEDIRDETRHVSDYTGWPSIEEAVRGLIQYQGLDAWTGRPPFIITESRSLAGVLEPLAQQYRVKITATAGQTAGFLYNDVREQLIPGQRILYLGDLDLCGEDIEGNSRRVLEQFEKLGWERLALTKDQADEHDLPQVRKTDKRFKGAGGRHLAIETEALSQEIIVKIVRGRLAELLPEPLEHVHEREAKQRRRILRRLQG